MQLKLRREVDHDRFTRLDRTLLNEAEDGMVDLRISPGQSYLVRANRHLLIARLQKLEVMELAKPIDPGVWELSPTLEPTLMHLGQRIDTIDLMQKALGEEAAERSISNFLIHRDVPRSPVTGHLRGKGLAGDGLADKVYLVIDGVDGRVHHVEFDAALVPDDVRIGAILTVGREPSARSVDKTIAALAARNHGFYEPRQHVEIAKLTQRIPAGDVEGHVEAHVRRLEALRRTGIVERLDVDHWEIPRDFLEQAATFDKQHGRKLFVEVHSAVDLDRQIIADAATWLDRHLVGRHRGRDSTNGVRTSGRERAAAAQGDPDCAQARLSGPRRRSPLPARPPGHPSASGARPRGRAARGQKRRASSTYVPARDGATIRGVYRGAITLTSGRFAVIASEQQFTLVPWRAILERFRGREIVGIVRGMGVSWRLGLQRSRGMSR